MRTAKTKQDEIKLDTSKLLGKNPRGRKMTSTKPDVRPIMVGLKPDVTPVR